MSDRVLFQMWEPFRQSLIEAHSFYVEQAQKRLLSQFDNIEADATRAADEWLEQRGQYFNPDLHNPDDFYDDANNYGIEFYDMLSEMREQTRLSVVAGMFHEWDKQLRDWLVDEIRHWHDGDITTQKVWSVNFSQIMDLLECLGWNICKKSYFPALDACRCVINVYKHGDGSSLCELQKIFPEYLVDPFYGSGGEFSDVKYRDHTHLRVSDDQFKIFSEAILSFWRDVPENVLVSQITTVPGWFETALVKGLKAPLQASKQ